MRWGMPFAKVEAQPDGTVIVEGVATDETPDMDGEVVDYDASKEAFGEWGEWRNVREMHQLSAVGTALEWWGDDEARQIWVRAQIVDPNAVKKVLTGVYKGYSVGGKKLGRRWENGRWRITKYRMVELSLVDRPNNPSARFALAKSAGANEFGEDVLEVREVAEGEREKLREQAQARAKKYGIAFKEGKGHLTPPKGYPEDPDQYGDPVNYAYPIDQEHIRPAVAYFNQEGQREDGGYTTEEWAIIGRRIAAAASRLLGAKYEYQDGKVKHVEEETKKAADAGQADDAAMQKAADAAGEQQDAGDVQKADGAPAPGEPGSPEWERVDAELLAQAVAGLKAVIDLIRRVKQREEAEMPYDHAADFGALWQALDHLTQALGITAGLAYTEAQEAQGTGEQIAAGAAPGDLQKVGKRLSKASIDKVHGSMMALAGLCGCEACQAFRQALGAGVDTEEAAKAKEGDKMTKAAQAEPQTSTQGTGTAPAPADLEATMQKVLDTMGIGKLGGAVEDLLKAAEALKQLPALEERIKRLEEQPMPGGPLLRGMATTQDYYLVRKGAGPVEGLQPGNEVAVLEQIAAEATDPLVRDVLSREIARRTYLAGRAGQQ